MKMTQFSRCCNSRVWINSKFGSRLGSALVPTAQITEISSKYLCEFCQNTNKLYKHSMKIDQDFRKIVISLGVALSVKKNIIISARLFARVSSSTKRFDYKFDAYLSFPLKESQV